MDKNLKHADAAIIGTYLVPCREEYLISFEDLAASAAIGLINKIESKSKKRFHRIDFDGIFLSSATADAVIGKRGQMSWESIFASNFGLTARMHAFSKSSEALNAAVSAIKAGDCKFVIVAACDKRSDQQHTIDVSDKSIDPNLRLWNWRWQNVYATLASKYLHETKLTHEDLISVAINDKFNAASSPKRISQFKYLSANSSSRLSFDPLTNFDFASTKNDGAAAILVTSIDNAKQYVDDPIYIKASVSTTGPSEFWNQENIFHYPALRKAAKIAYDKSKITPKDLDLVSVDTKVTIVGPLALEALKIMKFPALSKISERINKLSDSYEGTHIYFESEQGKEFILNPCGSTYVYGNVPGVSGLSRLIQLVDQLKCTARNQIENTPKTALLHEQSASGMKQMVHILSKYI
ncbi:MAG: thiolase family protein [Candidatus Helarchaeota archaeon]